MTITQKLCPTEKYPIKCPYTRTPSCVVIHNTANDAGAQNEIAYMISNNHEISYHYAVDDREAVQGLPLERNAWASGDGHGSGNMGGIHIEICYSLSGGERFTKAEQNAAKLTAQLLKQYGWGIEKVTKHQDYDGKYCPHRTLDLGWQRFLNMVKTYMKEDETVTYEQWRAFQSQYEAEQAKKNTGGWAKKAVSFAKENALMSGDSDGSFRPQSAVTREELAQVLYNYNGAGGSASDWAAAAWSRAVDAGIFDGSDPKAPLTREQLAVILNKLGLIAEKSAE